jgi:hypothetical protein
MFITILFDRHKHVCILIIRIILIILIVLIIKTFCFYFVLFILFHQHMDLGAYRIKVAHWCLRREVAIGQKIGFFPLGVDRMYEVLKCEELAFPVPPRHHKLCAAPRWITTNIKCRGQWVPSRTLTAQLVNCGPPYNSFISSDDHDLFEI